METRQSVLRVLILALLPASLLLSCKDDDDTEVEHSFYFNSYTGETRLQIIVTDGPVDGLRSVLVTVSGLWLSRGAGKRVAIFDAMSSPRGDGGPARRIDLLSLRRRGSHRVVDLLAADATVPAGSYDAVVLQLADPALVLETGEVVEGEEVDLAGGGALEIRLAEPLELDDSGSSVLLLDFDLDRSLSVRGREHDRWRLRPIVWTEFLNGELPRGHLAPLTVEGKVERVDGPAGTLLVRRPGRGDSVRVRWSKSTTVLRPATTGDLGPPQTGDPVVIRGELEADGSIRAGAAVIGETVRARGSLLESRGEAGVAATVPEWTFVPDPGQTIREPTLVELRPDTLFHYARNAATDRSDLREGRAVEILAWRPEVTDATLSAAVVDIEPAAASGLVRSFAGPRGGRAGTLRLHTTGGAEVRLAVESGLPVVLGPESGQPIETLRAGQPVRVHRRLPGSSVAAAVFLEPEPVTGRILEVNRAARSLRIVDSPGWTDVSIGGGARLLLVHETGGSLVSESIGLDDLRAGMTLEALGLRTSGLLSNLLVVTPRPGQ